MSRFDFKELANNPTLDGLANISPDIVYSSATGRELTMRVLSPWRCEENAERTYPVIVFVQGSGWTFPDINYEIPQLAWYARMGYVVATVTHRSCLDGYPFPAFLQDVKCAVRYMRAHAADFSADPERIGIFGTSSGGNTALLVGLTGDDPRYKTAEYADVSDAVKTVVECFGPTDMESMRQYCADTDFIKALLGCGVETPEASEAAAAMSPLFCVKDGEKYPPTLIIHGDSDPVVPYDNGLRMYERLKAAGGDVSMIRVKGAPHEGNFWSRELHCEILKFLTDTL